jgi:hypothetical protein
MVEEELSPSDYCDLKEEESESTPEAKHGKKVPTKSLGKASTGQGLSSKPIVIKSKHRIRVGKTTMIP